MATRLLTNKMLRNLEEMVEAVESEYLSYLKIIRSNKVKVLE
ncbi:putative phage regulatory protein [Staphylococcus aureus]|nr:putative phage regulatory protein [Staphylococcus aureus]